MKRYIKSNYVSYTSGPRSNRARAAKSSEQRKELYDRVCDIMEALGDAYADDKININVTSRGRKGNRLVVFRFESSIKTEGRYRFNKAEAEDVLETARAIVDQLGLTDRCDAYIIEDEDSSRLNGKPAYKVIIDVDLDSSIEGSTRVTASAAEAYEFPEKIWIEMYPSTNNGYEYVKQYEHEGDGCYYRSEENTDPVTGSFISLYPDGRLTYLWDGVEKPLNREWHEI